MNGRDKQIIISGCEFQSEGTAKEAGISPPSYVRVQFTQAYIDQARELLEKGQPGAISMTYACDISLPVERGSGTFGGGQIVVSHVDEQVRFEMEEEVTETRFWAHFYIEDAEGMTP